MDLPAVYMVRGGCWHWSFQHRFPYQIFFAFCTLGILLWGFRKERNLDYVYVSIFGTTLWTLGEGVLQLSGIRNFRTAMVFDLPLPLCLAPLCRVLVEGAFVTLFCLWIVDLSLQKRTRVLAVVGLE